MEKTCLQCNKTFVKAYTSSKNYFMRQKYCGQECYGLSKIGKTPWNLGIKTPGEVRKKQSLIKTGKPSWRKGKKSPETTGPKNPNWQGGKTKLSDKIRKSETYRLWRSFVYQRDGYSCVICKAVGDINADHIIPLSVIVRRNRIETFDQALECSELWDTRNGRTLCIPCHKKTPSYLVNYKKKGLTFIGLSTNANF